MRAALFLVAVITLTACKPSPSPPTKNAEVPVAADFRCPECNEVTLGISHRLEMPADGYSDDITLQSIRCTACTFRGVATYEESRRGSGESWHHLGAKLSNADYELLATDLAQCPTPGDRNCTCDIHKKYNQIENHSWKGLAMFEILGDRFTMELAK